MHKVLLISALMFLLITGKTQNIGIGTPTPDASALLDISSTSKGMLIPRMTAAERTAIAAPAEGLMVYQTDAPGDFFIFKNGSWKILTTAGGANRQVQFNDNGKLGGASMATINGSYLNIGTPVGSPDTPSTGANLFTQVQAGKPMLSQISPSGSMNSFQPFLGQKRVSWWSADGNNLTVSLNGFGDFVIGNSAIRTITTSSLYNSIRRIGFTTPGVAGSSAGTRHSSLQFFRGTAPGLGGFLYIARFGISLRALTQRSFVGLTAQLSALPNLDPSVNQNIIGFGYDSFNNNWTFMHNDAVGTATKENLTGSFLTSTQGTDMIEIRIYCAPNSTEVHYSIEVLGGGSYFEGVTSVDLPLGNVLLSPQIWTNNGTSNVIVGIDVAYQYMETDF